MRELLRRQISAAYAYILRIYTSRDDTTAAAAAPVRWMLVLTRTNGVRTTHIVHFPCYVHMHSIQARSYGSESGAC